MIKYTNISYENYYNLSVEERKKSYRIDYNGSIYWKVNRKLHREDGPAIECSDGTNYWYLNGIRYSFKDNEYSFEEWCKKLNKTDEEKVFLRLKYS